MVVVDLGKSGEVVPPTGSNSMFTALLKNHGKLVAGVTVCEKSEAEEIIESWKRGEYKLLTE